MELCRVVGMKGVPGGSSTQHLRLLVPKNIHLIIFEARDLKDWVLGPFASVCIGLLLPEVYTVAYARRSSILLVAVEG